MSPAVGRKYQPNEPQHATLRKDGGPTGMAHVRSMRIVLSKDINDTSRVRRRMLRGRTYDRGNVSRRTPGRRCACSWEVRQMTVIPCAVSRVMPGAVTQARSADVTAPTIFAAYFGISRLYDKVEVESD